MDENGRVMLGHVHEAQLRGEHEALLHGDLRAVDVVLLHIAADTREGGLLLRVTAHADIARDLAACAW